jgi:hypothetical protein
MECAWDLDDQVSMWTYHKGSDRRIKKYIRQSTALHTLLKQQPNAGQWSGQGMLQASEVSNA